MDLGKRRGPAFVLRMDDACPTMRMGPFERLAAGLQTLDVRPVIGVIPENANAGLLALGPPRPGFWSEMRDLAARGWTIAQHGYRHVAETSDPGILGRVARSEFAGLPYAAQYERLKSGQDKLASEGLETDVFMPPYHAFDDATLAALRDLGFRSLSDGFGLWPYQRGGLTLVPQLLSSFGNCGFGVYTVCLHPNTMSAAEIDRLLERVGASRAQFISYPQAVALVREGPAPVLLRSATRIGLHLARALRRGAKAPS